MIVSFALIVSGTARSYSHTKPFISQKTLSIGSGDSINKILNYFPINQFERSLLKIFLYTNNIRLIQAGHYDIGYKSWEEIFLNLSEGNIKEFRFKIQEGTNIFDLENQLRLSDLSFDCPEFNCLSNKFNFIEGTLMPDTYFYNFKSSASSILIKSQNSFIKYADSLWEKRNPLNPDAMNYNPNLQKQMDFLEGQTGTKITGTSGNLKFTDDQMMIGRDPNSGLAKYGPGSVLEGQNVVSGFGTNDYEAQLGKYISKMLQRKTLTPFQKAKLEQAKAEVAKEIARREQETADRARAANPGVYARADALGFTDGRGGGFGSRSTGTNENFSNETGRGRTGYGDGGLATMFKEKR